MKFPNKHKKLVMRIDGKTKALLIVFTIFLGVIGMDYFYVGRKKWGYFKLFLTWFGATLIVYGLTLIATSGYILTPPIVGGIIISGLLFIFPTLVWSIVNLVLILLDEFRDCDNKRISEWNSSPLDYIDNMTKGNL